MRVSSGVCVAMVVAGSLAAYGKDLLSDTSRIQSLTGMKGAWNAKEGVFKVSSPRTDLPVSVDGFAMPPFMGLTTWVGFFDGGKAEAMIMGDLVLFQDEVDPVLDALLASGVQVTALHNHFFYDNPKVYFMHVSGDDSLARLAGGVGKAMEAVKSIRKAHAALPLAFEGPAIGSPSAITPKPLEAVFGQEGEKKDGMIKFIFGRKTRMPCGCEAGKGMGVNTWAAFAGKDEAALVDGDFAMREEEIQGVLKALRQAGIHIVAIHQHMIEEKPRILFLHYWGKGKAAELAQGIRSALATQAKD